MPVLVTETDLQSEKYNAAPCGKLWLAGRIQQLCEHRGVAPNGAGLEGRAPRMAAREVERGREGRKAGGVTVREEE